MEATDPANVTSQEPNIITRCDEGAMERASDAANGSGTDFKVVADNGDAGGLCGVNGGLEKYEGRRKQDRLE